MKKIFLYPSAILVLLILSLELQAQTGMHFHYDAAGNRVKRELFIDCPGCKTNIVEKDSLGAIAVTIYPNPTEGHLTVNIDSKSAESLTHIYVFDLAGKMLIQKQVVNTGSADIDLTDHATGIYLLKLRSEEKTSEWKIIKQ